MRLLIDVIRELFSMFWADAGLCLGALAVVAIACGGLWSGLLPAGAALGLLVVGTVLTLLASVWTAARARQR
ncbi:MAG: hypothetical protein J7598_14935 [Mitsuaria chitosanitabida]|uniref:hypothetical protein n=1 Tax=Roseateles chitosanitabidus TaxID=65048 RepID=UPI001B0D9B1D|nr:hypothetical protein [Roseateles chitosanitabidus]MBO9687899.1 hypothetical protein [Roseateles chitosanitabidus]